MADQAVRGTRLPTPAPEPAPTPPPRPAVYVVYEHWEPKRYLSEQEDQYIKSAAQVLAVFDNLTAANECAERHLEKMVEMTKEVWKAIPPRATGGAQASSAVVNGAVGGAQTEIDRDRAVEREELRKWHNIYAGKYQYDEPPTIDGDGCMTIVVAWEGVTKVIVEKWELRSDVEEGSTFCAIGGLMD
ncbi:hypothetical protein LTR09_010944 [Extremus antarcticus]|uniref:Uncharacterized protein n=1 Tax=Extremus antarcticus TaxID=702011 RepID=A0AAJ0DCU9_9PEZI|nr:hypothetical protein LTR09_010944 [Extremus antarcticus]